ncbi:two component regulator with propeller domain [Mucilaginibacter gracilis]|uniref:histidine kinase n=1 Tax=Mucilaginibacter gracilis TaxID=423350 RepID=A0A495IU79_9SPHI|nr:hybrid sensor histidine kinase/response regulator transcription factor [Mucilaginibacter gracilis]RKR80132.1 two component regulator with propeller domain [Mucilaginibacter gracilis]
MKKILILIILQFILVNLSFSQFSFDHVSVSNGLSQSTVLSVLKDSRGYMWFGTRDRLNRYDARNIKIYNYNPADSSSISCNDYVFFVFEDQGKNIWIGTSRGLNRYIPESDSFERILQKNIDPGSLNSNNIYCSYQDASGRLWFGGDKGINMLSSSTSRKFIHFYKGTLTKAGLAGNQIYAICQDRAQNIWVGTTEGLTRISFKNGKYVFKNFTSSPTDPDGLDGNSVKTIIEDRKGNICIGTETGGLNLFNPKTSKFSHFKHEPSNSNSLINNDIRKIITDKNGVLWIGTMDGLNLFDEDKKEFKLYQHDIENRNSLSDNSIKDIYIDNYGTVWIGTMFGGVNIIHPNAIPFTIYQASKYKNSISGNVVSTIIGDAKQNLWIGTEGKGINYFDKKNQLFTHYNNDPKNAGSISANFVKAIFKDGDNNIWIGLHRGGLDLFQPSSNSFKHHRHNESDPYSISSDIVSCIFEDSFHRFWVGTSKGLDIFDKRLHQFRNYINSPSTPLRLSSYGIRCIYEDSHHNIWVGTTGGLNLMKAGSTTFTWFKIDETDEKTLRKGYINCINEDSDGAIWVGSFHGGLSRYDPQTQTFKTYKMQSGLPSDNVLNIQSSENHCLWVSTDNGLAKFNTVTQKFKSYAVADGLPTNEFSYNSSFKDASGNLYFGSYNGLISFNPRQIKESGIASPVRFTSLKLFNQPVGIKDNTNLLKQDISLTQSITFTAAQNVFSIDFAALDYNQQGGGQYMYKLQGFEKNWNYVKVPNATYTNLPAGDYDLLVKAGNNDGYWTNDVTSVHIVILPPLYKTWWAYFIYAICFAGVLFLLIRFFRRQARLERDLYYEHLNSERQQEVHRMKLDFFTKVSHEIRTPLTLILAPVEKMIDLTVDNSLIGRQLVYVKQNTDRLMRLVNELLDFRTIETGHMMLHVAELDIVKFCYDVYMSFESVSAAKNINYQFHSPSENVFVYFDAPQFEKVLFNILSNAFKFTPAEGTIIMRVDSQPDSVNIIITDNGDGISSAAQQFIFDEFYQDKQSSKSSGWGIGLALAKNITELHKGKITVKSTVATEDNSGSTCFEVSLLKGKEHFSEDEFADVLIQHRKPLEPDYPAAILHIPVPEFNNKEKQLLLIVEDNDEVRGFIKESLSEVYEIIESTNGLDGWDMACKIIPDLIVSDVTMPVMDGLEFCSKLKTDDRTSHIPVILLTAKAAHSYQLQGLETGADVYLTKPFSMQVLKLNIRNLILARHAMRKKYAQQITLIPKNKIIESPDEKFLNKLMDIVERKMEDPDFDVISLVNDIAMSQTVLYRKIKALTGLNIADFIKSARLKQAALLLAQNKLSVADVAYNVGFKDRKYFSKEFKKQFGKVPSEYARDAQPTSI